MKRHYASGSEIWKKNREKQEHEEKLRDSLLSFLKLFLRVQDAVETTKETDVVAATSNEGIKTSEIETPNPELYVDEVADLITFEGSLRLENTTKSDEKCSPDKTENITDFYVFFDFFDYDLISLSLRILKAIS
jgi:hypothetical protein